MPTKWTYINGIIHSILFLLGTFILNLLTSILFNHNTATEKTFSLTTGTLLLILGLAYVGYSFVKKRTAYAIGLLLVPIIGAILIGGFIWFLLYLTDKYPLG